MFFRYDPAIMMPTPIEATQAGSPDTFSNREFLFFGDLESDWRNEGEEDWDKPAQESARQYNDAVWSEAAASWDNGRLAAVFVSGT